MTDVPPSHLLPQYQNPTYPADANLTDDELAARARAASLVRAHSPGELICMMDGVSSWLTPNHTHTYNEFMDYRHSHVDDQGMIIADGEPWINWEPYDIWADRVPVPEPIPDLALPPPTGWQPIFSVRPGGIPYPTSYASSPWPYYSLAVEIDRSVLMRFDLGLAVRVRLLMWGEMNNIYIGPRSNKPFVATKLVPLTFKGKNRITTSVSEGGIGSWTEFVSDPIPNIDYRAGLHISWFSVNTDYGVSGVTYPLPGWSFRYIYWGYQPPMTGAWVPTTLDKTAWSANLPNYIQGIFLVECIFPDHPEAIPMQVYKRYSLGSPEFATPAPKVIV